jgi:hypothetical protein
MARSAWKRVLNKSSQIQVIGETTPLELIRNMKEIPIPEIVVAGFPFVESGLDRAEKIQKQWGNVPKTIILCRNKEEVKAAFKAHADWAAAVPFDDQDLITWIRALSDDAKRLCSEYLSELTALPQGSGHSQDFVRLIEAMLQLLFHPDLVNPERIESMDIAKLAHQGRVVFRNQARKENPAGNNGKPKFDEFWEDVRQHHDAKYVTVDVYNAEIPASAVQTLGAYLTDFHGSFGIIIGRGSLRSRLYPLTVAFFENNKRVILLCSDTEIQEMLEYKAGGVNPTCLLQDLYQKLIADAVK